MLRRWCLLLFMIGPTQALAQSVEVLPIEWSLRVRSQVPVGYEDGIVQRVASGIHLAWGPLRLELAPDLVYEQAERAESPQPLGTGAAGVYVNRWLNYIELPTRGASGWRFRPGESRVAVEWGPFGLEASTRTLRWGPGHRYGLILSAPTEGFSHVSGGIMRPMRTPIGSFHGRLMSGRLVGAHVEPEIPMEAQSSYRPKSSDWRYITGFDIGYGLPALRGLTVGASRTFVGYGSVLDGWRDYFPMFQPLTKDNFVTDGNSSGDDAFDQQLSLWFDWRFDDSGLRLWGEFGRNDHSMDLRDVFVQPEHSRAWVLGGSKTWGERKLVIEAVELQMTNTAGLRPSPVWYTHHIVRHGYTHRGRVLGASVGPGGNGRFIEYTTSGWKATVEQVERNRDLYLALAPFGGVRPWSDLTLGIARELMWERVAVVVGTAITKTNNLAFDPERDPWHASTSVAVRVSW